MKHKLSIASVFIVLGVFVFTAIPSISFAKTGTGKSFANPSWNQTLPSNKRFIVLTNMNQEAVLDMETGLVWERSPSTSKGSWNGTPQYCYMLKLGGRMGWRLPKAEELFSLMDPNNDSSPSLPIGHPFTNIQLGYWSSTTHPYFPEQAMIVYFAGPAFGPGDKTTGIFPVWCVRGGHGYDAY